MKRLLTPLALSSLLAATPAGASITAINWGGASGGSTDIVTGNVNISGGSTLSIDGTPDTPSYGTSGYYRSGTYGSFAAAESAGETPQFYGAVSNNGGVFRLASLAESDRIQTQGFNGTTFAVTFWDKTLGFADSAQSLTSISSLSSFTVESLFNSTVGNNGGEHRIVLRDGSNFFLSSSIGSLSGSSTAVQSFSLDLAALAALTWGTYNPLTDIADTSATDFQTRSFTDITGIGLYSDFTSTSTTPRLNTQFINVTVVPEPSAAALFGALAALGFIRRTR